MISPNILKIQTWDIFNVGGDSISKLCLGHRRLYVKKLRYMSSFKLGEEKYRYFGINLSTETHQIITDVGEQIYFQIASWKSHLNNLPQTLATNLTFTSLIFKSNL